MGKNAIQCDIFHDDIVLSMFVRYTPKNSFAKISEISACILWFLFGFLSFSTQEKKRRKSRPYFVYIYESGTK